MRKRGVCVRTCVLLNCMQTCCNTTQSLFSCCFLPTACLTADSALPCPGCWPRGLALVSCWFARPRSTRRSSSTTLPDPAAQTSSPWVRVPFCQLHSAALRCETLTSRWARSSQLKLFKSNSKRLLRYVRMICHGTVR